MSGIALQGSASGSPAISTVRTKRRSSWNQRLRRAYVPLGILAIWQAGFALGWIPAQTVPPPSAIAIAAWQRLEPSIRAAQGAELSRIRVYETPETFAEFRGGL